MFAKICDFNVKANNEKYSIALGYILPDDIDIKDIKEKPEFVYIIQKEIEEGKFEMLEPSEESLFLQLDSTAKIFTQGFIEGVNYYNEVYKLKSEVASNSNIITEK